MKPPFFHRLDKAQNVLIAGAGGGFDVFCGLPLYFYLRQMGKKVHLANLSFAELGFCDAERLTPALWRVESNTGGPANYFPEVYLAQWLTRQYGETPVYAIERTGAQPVKSAYEHLIQTLQPDALILIDGGTDSLMRGDEAGLGTPHEDMASLYAANAVKGLKNKFLVSIGFGVDTFHGVCHSHFLENVAGLISENAYLGAWSLTNDSDEFQSYQSAYDHVVRRMPRQPSIVNSSIISAINGWFGNQHAHKRTEGSELYINPLMGIYWAFDLPAVARRNLYLDQISQTNTYQELSLAIETFRATQTKERAWQEIPL